MLPPALRSRRLIGAIMFGILVSLATGLIENPPEASIIGARYYGFPLAWRITRITITNYTDFRFTNLALDAAFWITLSLSALIILGKVTLPKSVNRYKKLILPLVLFIPLGLVMDFVHEFGHAVWGVAAGGRLAYIKVAYLEIYPRLALTPNFALGLVRVDGLTGFTHGLFLLGGSVTTNIVSWLLALILLKSKLGSRMRVGLMILGLFGLLDLPLYVLLPQIGLQHWIFLGGGVPEPLIGAREIGMPDPVFYALTLFSTLGLALLYFESLRVGVRKKVNALLSRRPVFR